MKLKDLMMVIDIGEDIILKNLETSKGHKYGCLRDIPFAEREMDVNNVYALGEGLMVVEIYERR